MEIILPLSEIPPDLLEFFEPVDAPGNMEDVLKVSAEPLKEKHYAAFPTALVTKCLRAGVSERGYCSACGMPWVRVIEHSPSASRLTGNDWQVGREQANHHGPSRPGSFVDGEVSTIGWRASCSCDAGEPQPGLVLDPFTGSGRTAIAARRLGLNFVGCELNESFSEMARRLIREDMPLFNAQQAD